ncbi:MAG: 50S ribosomal protein L25/general stress protein Ctc [Rhizobiales bacterium]|nr:50S ribosomal protein L25/general stress protein Ctc [Hyphomicrobiales bacterium]
MVDAIELKATARKLGGKGAAKQIRRKGLVPAVVYGDKKAPEPVVLEYMPIKKQYDTGHFLSTIYTLDVDGKSVRVLPREIQLDPVRDFIIHVDFLRVSKDSAITVYVPVKFLNEDKCPGLKRGGALNVVRHEVELICPGDRVPDFIEVNLEGVEIGHSVHISAVKLPEGTKPTIADRDFTIATIAGAGGGEQKAEGEEPEAS